MMILTYKHTKGDPFQDLGSILRSKVHQDLKIHLNTHFCSSLWASHPLFLPYWTNPERPHAAARIIMNLGPACSDLLADAAQATLRISQAEGRPGAQGRFLSLNAYLGRIGPMDLKDPPIQHFLNNFDGSRSFSTGSFGSFCKLI